MSKRVVSRFGVDIVGNFGLLLINLVGALAPHVETKPGTYSGRVRRWLARRALDGIEGIGWLVDRAPRRVRGTPDEPKLTHNRVGARSSA